MSKAHVIVDRLLYMLEQHFLSSSHFREFLRAASYKANHAWASGLTTFSNYTMIWCDFRMEIGLTLSLNGAMSFQTTSHNSSTYDKINVLAT